MHLPIVYDGQKDSHEHVEVETQEEDEEEGVALVAVVSRHHHIRAVGAGNKHIQVPEGVSKVCKVVSAILDFVLDERKARLALVKLFAYEITVEVYTLATYYI